jgi:hypothetical protein
MMNSDHDSTVIDDEEFREEGFMCVLFEQTPQKILVLEQVTYD